MARLRLLPRHDPRAWDLLQVGALITEYNPSARVPHQVRGTFLQEIGMEAIGRYITWLTNEMVVHLYKSTPLARHSLDLYSQRDS